MCILNYEADALHLSREFIEIGIVYIFERWHFKASKKATPRATSITINECTFNLRISEEFKRVVCSLPSPDYTESGPSPLFFFCFFYQELYSRYTASSLTCFCFAKFPFPLPSAGLLTLSNAPRIRTALRGNQLFYPYLAVTFLFAEREGVVRRV